MGPPKQRWTSEEEAALSAGIAKHGVGKWRAILEDSDFSSTLWYRSNVNLKDKWRSMNATVTSLGHVKGKATYKKKQATPKNNAHAMVFSSVASDVDDELVDAEPIEIVPSALCNDSDLNNSYSRLTNVIMEAIMNLNESTGSQKITIANYIEEQYFIPSNFEHVLSAKLKDLTENENLIMVNRKYMIAPSSSNSEEQNPETQLLEGTQREPQEIGSNDVEILTKSQVDSELALMASMTAEEAEAAAARAVEEAEALMAEAKAAAIEAEAAEADAQVAIAFAEAALLAWNNRNISK